MSSKHYETFKKNYLGRFRKYYRDEFSNRNNRKELKRSIFENKNLTDEQKEDFWNKVKE